MQTNQLKQATEQAYNDFQVANENPHKDVLDLDKIDKIQKKLDKLSSQFDKMKRQQSISQVGNNMKEFVIASPVNSQEQKIGLPNGYVASNGLISSIDSGSPVSEYINNAIKSYLMENSVIRKHANNVVISRDSLEYVKNKEDITAQWSDGTTAPDSIEGYEKINIKVNDLVAQPKVTHKLLDDVEINFDDWLASELGQIFLQQENEAFINGDGVNKPKGILSYQNSIGTVASRDVDKITVDGLIDLIYSLEDAYANDAVMLMNKATVQEVRKLKDANGQYLWMPGILSGKSDTIMGVPLLTVSNVPSVKANEICAIYANLKKAYTIVDHYDINIQKDPFSAKPFISFYCTKRVGGDVMNAKAIKLLKIAA